MNRMISAVVFIAVFVIVAVTYSQVSGSTSRPFQCGEPQEVFMGIKDGEIVRGIPPYVSTGIPC